MKTALKSEEHRSALTGHCYRMLGSIVDAEDAVQETMVRAWKALDGFDGRSSLRTWLHRIATSEQRNLLDRYVDAFLRFDVDVLTSLLRDDAKLSMPPFDLWLQGRDAIRRWLLGPGSGCRGSKLVPTSANGLPAFAQWRDGGRTPFALIVLELDGARIASWNAFLDPEVLFPRFGMPLILQT